MIKTKIIGSEAIAIIAKKYADYPKFSLDFKNPGPDDINLTDEGSWTVNGKFEVNFISNKNEISVNSDFNCKVTKKEKDEYIVTEMNIPATITDENISTPENRVSRKNHR